LDVSGSSSTTSGPHQPEVDFPTKSHSSNGDPRARVHVHFDSTRDVLGHFD